MAAWCDSISAAWHCWFIRGQARGGAGGSVGVACAGAAFAAGMGGQPEGVWGLQMWAVRALAVHVRT